jgi:hypothetical protein
LEGKSGERPVPKQLAPEIATLLLSVTFVTIASRLSSAAVMIVGDIPGSREATACKKAMLISHITFVCVEHGKV